MAMQLCITEVQLLKLEYYKKKILMCLKGWIKFIKYIYMGRWPCTDFKS